MRRDISIGIGVIDGRRRGEITMMRYAQDGEQHQIAISISDRCKINQTTQRATAVIAIIEGSEGDLG